MVYDIIWSGAHTQQQWDLILTWRYRDESCHLGGGTVELSHPKMKKT